MKIIKQKPSFLLVVGIAVVAAAAVVWASNNVGAVEDTLG